MIDKTFFLVALTIFPCIFYAAASPEQAEASDAKSALIAHMKMHTEWYYQTMGVELEKVKDKVFADYLINIIAVAVKYDDRDGTELLLKLPGDAARKDNFFMRQAAHFGRVEIAQMLYDAKFSVDASSMSVDSPLENAVHNKKDAMVDWLIAKSADVHGKRRRNQILSLAVRSTDHIFDAILSAGASLDDPRLKDTLLHKAMETKNYHKIKILLAHGYDLNKQDARGRTPLLLAVQNKQSIETVDLLLNAGASPHIVSNDGLRPL